MTNFEKIKSMSEEEFLRCIMVCPNEFNYIGSEAWCKKSALLIATARTAAVNGCKMSTHLQVQSK
ncbi:MAG: hypothetical protein IJ009_07725 [Clostridia bacterium]|nr:hypothetical protein [Clostridia bacterium]